MNRFRHFSSEGCFAPFDTNSNGMLSIDEFTELCYKLFVGTDNEVIGGVYDFDPEAIFKWLTADSPAESGIKKDERDTSIDESLFSFQFSSSSVFELHHYNQSISSIITTRPR